MSAVWGGIIDHPLKLSAWNFLNVKEEKSAIQICLYMDKMIHKSIWQTREGNACLLVCFYCVCVGVFN